MSSKASAKLYQQISSRYICILLCWSADRMQGPTLTARKSRPVLPCHSLPHPVTPSCSESPEDTTATCPRTKPLHPILLLVMPKSLETDGSALDRCLVPSPCFPKMVWSKRPTPWFLRHIRSGTIPRFVAPRSRLRFWNFGLLLVGSFHPLRLHLSCLLNQHAHKQLGDGPDRQYDVGGNGLGNCRIDELSVTS